ncbi:MAG: AAA family ATPase, partial [Hyphomicrobiaceae bacterium]
MNTFTQDTVSADAEQIVARIEAAGQRLGQVRENAGGIIFGQDRVIERALIAILAGGHGLLIGVPGLAKTLLVDTLGTILGLDAKRIQFTPDLMPSDIIGSEVLEETAGGGARSFRFIKGPIFAQLLMADE